MNSFYCLIGLLLLSKFTVDGLECYTGYAIVRGRTVGTETKVCEKSSDMCYKANADMNTMIKLKLAGCSTWRCMLSSNGCTMHAIAGQSVELCCCSGDLCNAPESNTESLLKGLITHFTGDGGNSKETASSNRNNNRDQDHTDSSRNRDEDRNGGSDDAQRNRNENRNRGSDEDNRGSEVQLDGDQRNDNLGSSGTGRRDDDGDGENSGGVKATMNNVPPEVLYDIFQTLGRNELEKCQLICKNWQTFINFNGRSLPARFFSRITINEITGNLTYCLLLSDNFPRKVKISPSDEWTVKCLKYCHFDTCYIHPIKISTKELLRKLVKISGYMLSVDTLYTSGNIMLLSEILKNYLSVENLALTFLTNLHIQNVFSNPKILSLPNPPNTVRLICDDIPINNSIFNFIRSNEVYDASRYVLWIQGISPNSIFMEKILEIYETAEDLGKLMGQFRFTPNGRIGEFQLFNQNSKGSLERRNFKLTKEDALETYLVKMNSNWSAKVVFKYNKNNLPTETIFMLNKE